MTPTHDNHALKALAEEVRPELDDEWFEGATAYIGERVVNLAPCVQDGVSFFHGVWADARFESLPHKILGEKT